MSIDSDLDRLYQLKPSAFIAERNAIAKRAGPRAGDIRALPKPTAAVWAVNQLHWRKPELYRSLVQAAENLRATHKAVMSGRHADLRAASRAHEDALETALKATLDIAGEDGPPPSDATRQTIGTTLRALPAEDPPGRLRHALAPGGFEILSGLPKGGRVVSAPARKEPKREAKEDKAAEAHRTKQAQAAAKAIGAAEQIARREEFEAARTAREAEKTERRLARAREALEEAKAELEAAEQEADQARKQRDAARARSEAADQALADARSRVE